MNDLPMAPRLVDKLDRLQYRQELHDSVFHTDIYTLSKPRRLTHLVLHHCKYVSELHRLVNDQYYEEMIVKGPSRARINRLTTDGMIICLSMANVCNKRFVETLVMLMNLHDKGTSCDQLLRHLGRMAKTVEDIDHMAQTNPLEDILSSAAMMAVCYMNLWVQNQTSDNGKELHLLFTAMEDRLLQVEQKNIFCDRHLVEINRRMQIYDTRPNLSHLSVPHHGKSSATS